MVFSQLLNYKGQNTTNKEFTKNLQHLRSIVDEIDEEIINWLAKRMDVIDQIGEYKRDNNITVLQLERWLEIINTRTAWAETKGLNKEFIQKVCQIMHKESIRKQTDLINTPSKTNT